MAVKYYAAIVRSTGETMSNSQTSTMTPASLSFPPLSPTVAVPPTKIAEDTWVIHQVQPALGQPLDIYINSMVIRGSEPVIVDTGTPANRKQWLEDAFTLVDPKDVKWIFLSHDDVDHTGNLDESLTACPNAKVVCSWAMVERHTNCFDFPLHRCRWVTDGESFDVGDRTLVALRPPVFDSPTTRGLYDPKTKVYWAVDTFATPLPDKGMGIADLDHDFWYFGLMLFALGAVSPWITWSDPAKYNKIVDRVQSLDITTIASCHSPVIEGEYIGKAFERIRQLPTVDLPELPDQSVLDQIIAATAQAPS
jgi:flavorubredoxin